MNATMLEGLKDLEKRVKNPHLSEWLYGVREIGGVTREELIAHFLWVHNTFYHYPEDRGHALEGMKILDATEAEEYAAALSLQKKALANEPRKVT